MAPPGRRKSPTHLSPLAFFLILVLLFSSTASAASAVLGIDLGTEYLKAAIAKPGSPIEIVLTKDSKRKEAASLAFKPSRAQANDPEGFPERLYGGDAVALSARYPGDVYSNLKSLLGLARFSDAVKDYSARYPGLQLESVARFTDGNTRGTVGFRSQNFGDKRDSFMVEELLAMELKNIKANAEATVGPGSFVTDVVITYPAFYTAEEKRAVELAVELAGLRLLGMVSDGLAVGLNYATTRVFDSISDGAKPEYHLVYDMGAGSTTATVLKFQGRTIKDVGKRNKTIQEVHVIGTGYDRTLGGDSLNDVIVADMINQLVESNRMKPLGVEPIHIKKHGKSMSRLWKEAERLRQVLSANSLTSASFEGIYYDDVNFKYNLDRDHFEKLTKTHAARVTLPLTQALDAAGIGLEELDSIILHGGVVRTPFVQKQLDALAGASNKIKTNVNADEAAVLGAAFKAAGISPSFRVKDIRANDVAGTAFSLKWTTDAKEKQQKLFTSTSQVGAEKSVPIKVLEDVQLEFSQSVGEKEVPITLVEALNLTKSTAELKNKYGCAAANISTVFTMRLNPLDGLPEILSGSVSCLAEPAKEGGVMDNVKGLFGFGSKKDSGQEPLGADADEDPTTLTPLPVDDPTSSGTTISQTSVTESGSSSTEGTSKKSAKSAVATPKMVHVPLLLKTSTVGLNSPPVAALSRIRQRLTDFDSSDRKVVLRSEALNTLEAFTYRARDYLSDESFIAVSSETFREQLEKQVSSTSDWLYGDGLDAKLEDFKQKLKDLKSLINPVLKRIEEGSGRDSAVKALRDGLENVSSMIQMVEGSIEKAAQEAAASISSAASSVVESASSVVAPSPSPSAEADDLDDDPYSSASSTTESDAAKPSPTMKAYEYTQEDLSSMTRMYDSVKTWLEEKLSLQEQLGPYDDPAVLVSELELKARQLQTTVSDLIMKTIKKQEMPKRKAGNGGPKKEKTKAKKSKSGKDSATSSSEGEPSATSTSTSTSVKPTVSQKDEL